MELVKTIQVFVKNKVSTSLKTYLPYGGQVLLRRKHTWFIPEKSGQNPLYPLCGARKKRTNTP